VQRAGVSAFSINRSGRQPFRLILVLGGAASGKSQAALELAGGATPKAFVATGQALDQEMAERIRRHQASRSADWHTAEVPMDLSGWLRGRGSSYRTIVIDCLTLWLSNLQNNRVPDTAIPQRVGELLDAIRSSSARVVLVSNEVGLGLVPVNRAGRRFRDVAGKVHQQIATSADEVHFILAGQSLRVK
jgi:adenosylcobinamide kinase/adenosylcobinamide-phosphate guanylyltransferase